MLSRLSFLLTIIDMSDSIIVDTVFIDKMIAQADLNRGHCTRPAGADIIVHASDLDQACGHL